MNFKMRRIFINVSIVDMFIYLSLYFFVLFMDNKLDIFVKSDLKLISI